MSYIYTLIANSTSVLRSDTAGNNATIPADPTQPEWQAYQTWLAAGNVPNPVPSSFSPAAVKYECANRIYTIASASTQMNMTAYIASGGANEADKAIFSDALSWIASMRAACASLIAAGDVSFAQDSHWPACPQDVLALVARF